MSEGRRPRSDEAGTERSLGSERLLVHVHISRTGGSTLNHILRSSYGVRHCPVEPWDSRWGPDPFSREDLRKLRRIYPNLRSIAGHRIFGYVDLEDAGIGADYFAIMRDPVRAVASRFQRKVDHADKGSDEFEAWIQKDWTRNRHVKAIGGTDDVGDAIKVIRDNRLFMGLTERYDETVVLLKKLLAPDLNISYKPVNVASKKTVAKELLSDDRLRGMIEESQSADLELFRYVKDVLWPEYLEAYGEGFEADVERFAASPGTFNNLNILLSRLKAHGVYRPALYLHRRGLR